MFSRKNITSFINSLQTFKSIAIAALSINLIFLLFFNTILPTANSPEFNVIKIFLIFNSFFLAELTYLIFSQYPFKNAFLYSFSSNYLICALYFLITNQMLKFCNNLIDADTCCLIEGWSPTELRIYILRSTWLEYILFFLLLSTLVKLITFFIFNKKNNQKYLLDFFIVNLTFLIFYFALSDNYSFLNESINTYYKNKLYSFKTYEVLSSHYSNDNYLKTATSEEIKFHKIIFEKKKILYSKPNNLLSKILDLFVNEINTQ